MGVLALKELLAGDIQVSRTTLALAAAGFLGAVILRQFCRVLRRMGYERWQEWALRRAPGSCCHAIALMCMTAAEQPAERRLGAGLLALGRVSE